MKAVKRRPTELKAFAKALDEVCLDLALQVVKDGEGAEKLVEITVSGAENDEAARRIGLQSAIRRSSRPRSPARTPIGGAS